MENEINKLSALRDYIVSKDKDWFVQIYDTIDKFDIDYNLIKTTALLFDSNEIYDIWKKDHDILIKSVEYKLIKCIKTDDPGSFIEMYHSIRMKTWNIFQ